MAKRIIKSDKITSSYLHIKKIQNKYFNEYVNTPQFRES